MNKFIKIQEEFILQVLSLLNTIKGKTRLMKFLFLLEKSGRIGVDFSFEPKHYGPYSKCIDNLLDNLKKKDKISSYYDQNNKTVIYSITDKGYTQIKNNPLNNRIFTIVEETIGDLRELNLKELINLVYSRYPEYTFLSKIKK